MTTFLMLGQYTSEAIKGISGARTQKAVEAIGQLGGKIQSIYGLLGEKDLALMVELPGLSEAMKASVVLNQLTGIAFTTLPAIAIEQFDQLLN